MAQLQPVRPRVNLKIKQVVNDRCKVTQVKKCTSKRASNSFGYINVSLKWGRHCHRCDIFDY